MSPRRVLGLPIVMVAMVALAGCGGGSGSGSDHPAPAAALRTAEQKLASTSGVSLTLTTDDLPSGVEGVKGADGTVTDAPAFDGTLTVVISAGTFQVPVKSVAGKVYAKIPLTPGFAEVNPGDYGAPDPGQLIDADQGIPAILTATTAPKAGGQVRGGADNEVLSTYTGSVPATAVSHLIPGASGDFTATYGIADNGELRQASLTGVFYHGKPSMTYTLVLDHYGTSTDIAAP
jgi:lipoprotein LprG